MKYKKEQIAIIKYGGAAMQSVELMQATIQDVATLKKQGFFPVIVHGGGPVISSMCQKMGIQSQFINGLRVTDKATMEIVQMALVGKINKELVTLLNQQNTLAVGISGHDAELLIAKKNTSDSSVDMGFVGDVEKVHPQLIELLLNANYVPVIAPIATSKSGESYNVNADAAASAIAIALGVGHLIFLTDVAGILRDPQDATSKIEQITNLEIDAMISSGKLHGGMLPKISGALGALKQGVQQVHIVDGRAPHCLIHHFNSTQSVGTTIRAT